ncbi:Formate--tetrahydrofolate ligase [Lysinibacillus sphaericus]
MHGGVAKTALVGENVPALLQGIENLAKHVETIRTFGVEPIIALNRFMTDTEAELEAVLNWCQENHVRIARTNVWKEGGKGGLALAEQVISVLDEENNFSPLYDVTESIEEKVRTIVQKVYGGKDVQFTDQAKKQMAQIKGCCPYLAGQIEADAIAIDRPNKYRIAYLPQEPTFNSGETVLQAVFAGDSPVLQLNRQYEETVAALAMNPTSESLQKTLFSLQQRMDEEQAWDVNALAKTALTKLGIEMFDKEVLTLSGGQQKRVALAKVLIEPADLYLLDEPTNHLDVQSTEWLQEMVLRLKGAVIFITHDRYFLDELSTHIYEIADQTLYRHTGNYGDFLEARAIREEMAAASAQKDRNRYRSELKWIRRGAKARSTKQKARIQRFEQLEDNLERKSDDVSLELGLATTRLGRKVLEAEKYIKGFWCTKNR